MKQIRNLLLILAFVAMGNMNALAQVVNPVLFDTEEINFGKIPELGGEVESVFEFTNGSDKPIEIQNAFADCGCTTPEYSKSVVEPGKKGFIKVRFNPVNKEGNFEKNITIRFKNDPAYYVVKVKGNIEKGKNIALPKPVSFLQYFPYNKKTITATGPKFIAYIDSLVPLYKKNGGIRFKIESSASNVPTEQYKSNDLLALDRIKETKKRLLDLLQKKGIASEKIQFADEKWHIQGPTYNKDYLKNIDEYEKWQYVKISAY